MFQEDQGKDTAESEGAKSLETNVFFAQSSLD